MMLGTFFKVWYAILLFFINTFTFGLFGYAPIEHITKNCIAISSYQFKDSNGNIFEINNDILRVDITYKVVFYTCNTKTVLDDKIVDFNELELYELELMEIQE